MNIDTIATIIIFIVIFLLWRLIMHQGEGCHGRDLTYGKCKGYYISEVVKPQFPERIKVIRENNENNTR